MAIYGIGIDICEIERIEHSLNKHGDLFADKILNENEKARFQAHRFKARFLAKRFAAKEAFAKAMGTGIADGVAFANIEIVNDAQGKPWIRLHNQTKKKLDSVGNAQVHLSISDERSSAIAQVIIEC